MRALEENLYRVAGSLILVMICLTGFGTYIGIGAVTAGYVITAILVIAACSAFCGLRLTGRLLMCLFIAGCVLAALIVAGGAAVIGFFGGYLSWLWGDTARLPAESAAYPYLQTLLLAAGCFVFHLLSTHLRWLEALAAGAVISGLAAVQFLGQKVSHLCVVFSLLYVGLVYVSWTRERWNKRKNGATRPFVAWILPFLGVYLLLMLIMPSPDQPYGWPIVRRVYHNLREAIVTISENYFSGQGEDFGSMGFSGSGTLAGDVQADDEVIMTLTVRNRRDGTIYLSGKAYDQFTGRKWQQTTAGLEQDRDLDAMETLCALYCYDKQNLSAYLSAAEIDVTYRYFHTNYLFAPLKTWYIAGEEGKKHAYRQENGDIVFARGQSYGTHYTVNYFQVNAGHEAFDRFLAAGQELDEANWQRVQREYGGSGNKIKGLDILEGHREQIHEIYGNSPVLSERVTSWLAEVMEGAGTDVEKLRALEAALSDYTYTRTPGELSELVDSEETYLDYFLLESRSGFCSYFATAFVLLARAEGIPARYVEGFCVPVEKQGETNVYSYMAHAWPEVYFDGVGWIPFEPTPGYENLRYSPWTTVFDQSGPTSEYDRDAWLEWLESREEQTGEEQAALEKNVEKKPSGVWKVVGYALLLNLILLFFGLLLVSLVRSGLRARWDFGRLFAAEVKRSMQLLNLLGYHRQPWETLEELGRKAGLGLKTEETGACRLRFLELYEETLYGERPVDAQMLAEVQREGRWLEELLRERAPRRYVYYKLVRIFI